MYPTGVKIYLDGKDITRYIFNSEIIVLSDADHVFRNIDLTSFIKGPGLHTLEVTADSGTGRVEARVEIR